MSNLQSNLSLRGDETMKNFNIRCNKHKKYRKESEPVKYVIENPSHYLNGKTCSKLKKITARKKAKILL